MNDALVPGDVQLLERLMAQYGDNLLRMCWTLLHDRELARDAVQETFLKAYRSLAGLREGDTERAWLMRIAVNTCRDIQRSRWWRMVNRSITPDDLPEPAGDAVLPVSAGNPQSADWRWADTLGQKLGSYLVTINAASGEVLSAEWSLEGISQTQAYSENNWADAPAYTSQIMPYVLALLHQTEAIIVRYPEDQREWFSVEDAAAYDQAFRSAGFDAAAYNHGLPRDTDSTATQATALAMAAMTDGYALTEEEQLSRYTLTVEYLLDNGGTWWIGFNGSDGTGYVSLNAADREIQSVTLTSAAASNG